MMKKYIKVLVVVVFGLLAVSTYTLYNRNQDLKEELSISISNEKAFITENSSLKLLKKLMKIILCYNIFVHI